MEKGKRPQKPLFAVGEGGGSVKVCVRACACAVCALSIHHIDRPQHLDGTGCVGTAN